MSGIKNQELRTKVTVFPIYYKSYYTANNTQFFFLLPFLNTGHDNDKRKSYNKMK